jgi:hypothetical protein
MSALWVVQKNLGGYEVLDVGNGTPTNVCTASNQLAALVALHNVAAERGYEVISRTPWNDLLIVEIKKIPPQLPTKGFS